MATSSIIGLAVIAALILIALLVVISQQSWNKGYKQGFKHARMITNAVVNDILKRAGETEEIPDDRVDGASEEGSEED